MPSLDELQHLLDDNRINSIPAAMRSKELAKLGDPLTNLIHSLAQSKLSNRFYGKKVSGKTLAKALRLANLRQIAPPRLDAHGLGDCVEAMIAYGWIQGLYTISEAASILAEKTHNTLQNQPEEKISKSNLTAIGFAEFLRIIWERDQIQTRQSQ